MNRLLPIAILLMALYTTVALGGPSTEIVVAKPKATSPEADLRDKEFQEIYDGMWTDFQSDVDAATADLKKVIGELREEAQKGGHAALTQRWDSMRRDFTTTGEVRWDHIKEKKDWRANYPGTVCPERFNRAVKACVNAYDQARRDLRAAYDDLARRLTVADKVERAKEIMEEATNTLGAEVEGPKKPVPPPLQLTLLQKLVGKWTHPKSDLMYYFLPDGTFHEDWKANGKVNATGRLVLLSTDLAEIKLSNAYRIQIRMAGDDILAVLVWDSKGNPWGQGMVLERQKDRVPPK
jgi:hypothetical protein